MSEEKISLTVGEKIAYYRKQKKLSQDALADLLKKSRGTINGYENNKIELTHAQLQQIAEVLEVNINDLNPDYAGGDKKRPTYDELLEEINALKKELETKNQLIEANKKLITLYEKDLALYTKMLEDNEKLYNAVMKKFNS